MPVALMNGPGTSFSGGKMSKSAFFRQAASPIRTAFGSVTNGTDTSSGKYGERDGRDGGANSYHDRNASMSKSSSYSHNLNQTHGSATSARHGGGMQASQSSHNLSTGRWAEPSPTPPPHPSSSVGMDRTASFNPPTPVSGSGQNSRRPSGARDPSSTSHRHLPSHKAPFADDASQSSSSRTRTPNASTINGSAAHPNMSLSRSVGSMGSTDDDDRLSPIRIESRSVATPASASTLRSRGPGYSPSDDRDDRFTMAPPMSSRSRSRTHRDDIRIARAALVSPPPHVRSAPTGDSHESGASGTSGTSGVTNNSSLISPFSATTINTAATSVLGHGHQAYATPTIAQDEMHLALLASQAAVDCGSLPMASWDVVEEWKKELSVLSTRLEALQARHQREVKILMAARTLQKLNESHKRLSKQTMESLEQSEKRVESAEKEVLVLRDREATLRRQLMEHWGGVMAWEVRRLERVASESATRYELQARAIENAQEREATLVGHLTELELRQDEIEGPNRQRAAETERQLEDMQAQYRQLEAERDRHSARVHELETQHSRGLGDAAAERDQLSSRVQELETDRERRVGRIAELEDMVLEMGRRERALEDDARGFGEERERLARLDQERAAWDEERARFTAEREQWTAREQEWKTERANRTRDLDTHTADRGAWATERETLVSDHGRLQGEHKQLASVLDALRVEHTRATDDLKNARAEHATVADEHAQMAEELNALRSKHGQATHELHALRATQERVTGEMGAAATETQKLQDELAAAHADRAGLLEQMNDLNLQRSGMADASRESKERSARLGSALGALLGRSGSVDESQHADALEEVRALLAQKEHELSELRDELREVNDGHAREVQRVATDRDARKAEAERAARHAAEVETRVSDLEHQLRDKDAQAARLAEMERQLQDKEAQGARLADLERQLKDKEAQSAQVTDLQRQVQDKETQAARLADLQRKLLHQDEQARQLADLRRQVQDKDDEITALNLRADVAEKIREQATAKVMSMTSPSTNAALESKASALEAELARTNDRLAKVWITLPTPTARADAGLSGKRVTSPNSSVNFAAIQRMYGGPASPTAVKDTYAGVDALAERIAGIIQDGRLMAERMAKMDVEKERHKANVAKAAKLVENSRSSLETYQKQVRELQERLKEQPESPDPSELETLRNDLVEARSQLADAHNDYHALESQLAAQDAAVRKLQESNDALSARAHSLSGETEVEKRKLQQKLQGELEELRARLKSAAGEVDDERARGARQQEQYIQMLDEFNTLQAEVQSLRQKLRSRGVSMPAGPK